MSSTTLPISPAAFSEAIKDLPISTLHLKAAELRNSIAHLDYSNEQLKPFAEGTEPSSSSGPDPDCVEAIQENEAVIKRMEERIALLKKEVEERGASWTEFQTAEEISRRREAEGEEVDVNGRGVTDATATAGGSNARSPVNGVNGEQRSSPWTDGTFQTGRIVNGEVHMDGAPAVQTPASAFIPASSAVSNANRPNGVGVNGASVNGTGGRLDDEALRRAMEERMRNLATDDDDDDEGMHL